MYVFVFMKQTLCAKRCSILKLVERDQLEIKIIAHIIPYATRKAIRSRGISFQPICTRIACIFW